MTATGAPPDPFAPWLSRWRLSADGPALRTHAGALLPVRTLQGIAAMLKVPHGEEGRRGNRLMPWWSGDAAPVLHGDAAGMAIVLLRAQGDRSLARWSHDGRDDDATGVLCATATRLHAPRAAPPPSGLVPLHAWFAALGPAARTHGGVLARADTAARALLDAPLDDRPLHGDLHHDNVLDFGADLGWLAIDPHALVGDSGFDYANLFRNPQPPGIVASEVALQPGVFERRLRIVADAAGIERRRLLHWILACCGLSAAWILEDGGDARFDLSIAERAAALLDG